MKNKIWLVYIYLQNDFIDENKKTVIFKYDHSLPDPNFELYIILLCMCKTFHYIVVGMFAVGRISRNGIVVCINKCGAK